MKRTWRYVFPALYGLLIFVTIRLLLDTVTQSKFWRRPLLLDAIEILTSIISGYVFIWAFNRLIRYFDSHWTSGFSYKRVAKELFFVYLVSFVIQNALGTTVTALTDDGLQWYDFADINIVPILYALIYYGIIRSNSYMQAYFANKLQLEKIKNDNLETELKFLKAQFHPHFLFNALNTIYFQMDKSVADAKKTVEKFSELLRYQLYNQQQTVSINQEIHYLQNFIQLQQIRSSKKLQISVCFDEKLKGQQVYPLLFLPLVENAFKYVGGDYWIRIIAGIEGDSLQFSIHNAVPAGIPNRKAGGIGLENLRRRLELLYPGKHVLRIDKKADEFLAVLTLELENTREKVAHEKPDKK